MPPSEEELVGQTIGGYELLELVGEGGMGAVYRARQISLDREVAVKVLAPRLAKDGEFVARFVREARSVAKINHPNILQIHDVADADGLHFIAMEFIRGRTLSDLLKDKGYLDWRDCVGYARQAALGLAAAAKANIIHRDVKPDNLMITSEGVVKVSDFGLAKEMAAQGELTQTGDIMGTPAYMSPEQCDGAALDTRTDIYSLGCALYRAVTGVLPFNAPSPVSMMYKHKHEAPIPPRQYMPELPVAVENLILRMMAKNPDDRYATMDETAETLERALEGGEVAKLHTTEKLPAASPSPVPPGPLPLLQTGFAPSPLSSPFAGPSALGGVQVPAPSVDPLRPASASGTYEEYLARGDRLISQGRPVAACEQWRKALALRPGDRAAKDRIDRAKNDSTVQCLKIGEGLLEQGKLSALRAELTRVLQADPENVDAQERLAALEFMERKRHDALLEIRRLLSSNRQEEALTLWDGLHVGLRDKALAPTIDNLRERVIPCKLIAAEAEKLSAAGHFDESMQKWDEALRLDPTNDKVKLARQHTLRLRESMEAALREGYEFHVQRKYEAAVSSFDKVLAIQPGHVQAARYKREALAELAQAEETAHDYEAAIKRWKQVLECVPGDKKAMERLEAVTRRRNALEASLEEARDNLGKGRYRRATSMWRKALEIQPGNKNALYGLAESKSGFRRRRLLPICLLALLTAGGGGGFLFVQFKNNLAAGDTIVAARLVERYPEAEECYKSARAVPLVGALEHELVDAKLAAVTALAAIAAEEKLYASGDLERLEAGLKTYAALLDENGWALDEHEYTRARFAAEWHIAHLLAVKGKYPEAQAAYAQALEVGQQHQVGFSDPVEDNMRLAIIQYNEATKILAEQNVDRAEQEARATETLQKALGFWADLREAQTLLADLQAKRGKLEEKLAEGKRLLETVRSEIDSANYAAAETNLAAALECAKQALKLDGENWAARKLAAEAEWRQKAGRDMAVFIYPYPDDPELEGKFRAFALDRCEWPNQKNAQPLTPTFAKALELARAAGKDLPYLDEWQWAAGNGREKRAYSFGNKFDSSKCNAGGTEQGPRACGEVETARSASGLYDLTGNVAEWVRDRLRDERNADQYVIGGSYASDEKDCRTDRPKLRDARVSSREVGFRAALRWEIKR